MFTVACYIVCVKTNIVDSPSAAEASKSVYMREMINHDAVSDKKNDFKSPVIDLWVNTNSRTFFHM